MIEWKPHTIDRAGYCDHGFSNGCNAYDAYFGGVIFYIKDSDLVLDLTHDSHDLYLDFLEFKEVPLENTNDPNYMTNVIRFKRKKNEKI